MGNESEGVLEASSCRTCQRWLSHGKSVPRQAQKGTVPGHVLLPGMAFTQMDPA